MVLRLMIFLSLGSFGKCLSIRARKLCLILLLTFLLYGEFKAIKNKKHHSFICFNIEEFYLSISQYLLNRALDFASAYNNITDNKRNIITHAKQSILVHKQQPWQNKGDTTFDVTMGSYDGAETCKLEGNFLLSQLQNLNINTGLYRDNGLAISNTTPRDTENIKKEICCIFNHNRLWITIEANK